MKKFEKLPSKMQTEEVLKYYNLLKRKKISLFFKRGFDIAVSAIMLILFSPVFLVLAVLIKIDSKGPVFYRQTRVTKYDGRFRIFKFRSMVRNSGSAVTLNNDARITKVGKLIRKCRLDEISQLIDIFRGKMTFVGTRPEVPKYTEEYTPEMRATFLMPAGVTGLACIYFKNEAELFEGVENTDKFYIEEILPAKMYYNLKMLEEFSFWNDLKIMFMTVFALFGKEYVGDYKKESTVSEGIAKEKEEIK